MTNQSSEAGAVTVLLVEDNQADARLVRELLRDSATTRFDVVHVTRLGDAIQRAGEGGVDVILLDLSLPDAHGIETVTRLHAAAPQLPIVVMSGRDDESLSVDGVREGAQDYLVKGRVDAALLVRALRYAMERQRQEDRLNHLAHHDVLTGLPNRALFLDRLRQALARARRHNLALGLLFLDLDGFKAINDTLGHDAGDLLLREVARRLKACTREGDTVARLGGDEFTVILPDVARAHDAATVARKIIAVLSTPLLLDGHEVHAATSIGIGMYPNVDGGVDELLKCADTAMYRAKEQGKNGYEFFTEAMTRETHERFALEQELRQALTRGELTVRFQPVVETAGARLATMEALPAWRHPRQGLLTGDQLLPLAEQSNLIAALTRWTLEAALAQCRAWQKEGLRLGVAVKLSIRALYDPDLPETIAALLRRHQIEPARLTLDVDEAAIMADAERARAGMARLAHLGVRLAVGGFGRAQSSLAHLKRLPADEVKIDRSLVAGMGTDRQDAAVVCSLIGMIHALRLEVVAEGVTDQAAYDLLDAVGCDMVQGHHICGPLPADGVAAWARDRHGASVANTPLYGK